MLIAISGKARSGKDTFAEYLAEELFKVTHKTYVLMAYATELKNRVQQDFDLSYEQLWGDEKEIPDKRYLKSMSHDDDVYWTPREILQDYGQFHRTIDYQFWVKQLFNIIDRVEYENVIITDCRHPNEIDVPLDRGGYHIKVEKEDRSSIHNSQHISETILGDGYKVDIELENNGTLEDLRKSTTELVSGLITLNNIKGDK